MHRVWCGLLLLLWAWPMVARGEDVRLDVTRDTWVSAVGQESDGNNGGASRLKLKGVQELAIIDIDPERLKGRVVTAAELHVKDAAETLGRVTVSSLATEWEEGTASGYQKQPGAASFRWAKTDQQPWAFSGSDLTAAALSQGHTVWRFADATPRDKEGWQVIAVDPAVVAARVAGVSHGFVVNDDVGSEYEHDGEHFKWKLFPNRFVFSHEQSNGKPYFVIHLAGEDREGPAAPVGFSQSKELVLPPGEAVVTWQTPADRGSAGVIGFIARYAGGPEFDWDRATPVPQYLVPMADVSGQTVAMHVRDLPLKPGVATWFGVRAIDRAGNVSPVATVSVTPSDAVDHVELRPSLAGASTGSGNLLKAGDVGVAIIDALDKVQPVTGAMTPGHPAEYLSANHLWSATEKTVHLYAARNEAVDFQVVLEGEVKHSTAAVSFGDGSAKADVFRLRSIPTKAGPMPDPLVPIDAPDEPVEGQKFTPLFVELYVPHDARPGEHTGTLTVTADGKSVELKVVLHVWDFTLPDVLSFVPEMNCYGLPEGQETAYYRLAHANRTNLNCLGYSWQGKPRDGGWAPKWDGKRFQWEAYDRRFGPLLDGSAFGDLPRKGVPLDAMYLPLCENWPVPIEPHFHGGYWADKALDDDYRRQFTAACAAFARHFAEKGWTRTLAEFYLNNKVYFKKPDHWSSCSAPWIFDEPVNAQDFWALRQFGILFHAGTDPVRGDAKLAFRCDISYPQWQRDFLDGILDVNVSGGDFRHYHRAVSDRQETFQVITYNYGSANNLEDSNCQGPAWCLDTWCLGGDGVLPWQTVGEAKSWKQADPLCLFYPDAKGPVPSVRLKGFRRGQQDVEYLTLLLHATRAPRFALANTVTRELKLAASLKKDNADDAGLLNYGQLDPAALWNLRVRLGATLDSLHPKPERQVREWSVPRREVSKLPGMGYVRQ